ncbi:MAG: hypothetical protein QM747_17470 [Nocardioides sp.]
MSATDDYCELCDLPRSQCVHGQPPPAPAPTAATRSASTPPKPRKKPVARVRSTGGAERSVTLRWTPPEAFKPLIVAVLQDAGGELDAETLFEQLEVRVGEQLRPADSERTPEGELRWQYAARRARVALIDDGLMTRGRPGVWQLTE